MKKIVVIEDEDLIRENILDLLSLQNFTAIGANNGREGLALIQAQQPDLVLCDVMMPDLNGYEVLTTLRQNPGTAMTPFIFLTAQGSRADMRQGMEMGADDYLIKPFTADELLTAIATQLSKREVIDQRSQQQLDELRSSISLSLPHELLTPLNGILGLSTLLVEDYENFEPAEIQEMAQAIHTSGERLHRLMENFLLHLELELIAANPQAVLGQAVSDAQPAIAAVANHTAHQYQRSGDLQLTVEPGRVLLPESELHKIVGELVDNAFKFSLAGTPVQMTGIQEDKSYELIICDRGRGMTPEQQRNLGAYWQFERQRYAQAGTGLGWAIAKRLTELRGGSLTIESIPAQQTLVRLRLPI